MKITVPAKEIEFCDICQCERKLLKTCLICGKQYCFFCEALIPGCMISANIGKCCGKRNDVWKIINEYADQIIPILDNRDSALKRLPKLSGATMIEYIEKEEIFKIIRDFEKVMYALDYAYLKARIDLLPTIKEKEGKG